MVYKNPASHGRRSSNKRKTDAGQKGQKGPKQGKPARKRLTGPALIISVMVVLMAVWMIFRDRTPTIDDMKQIITDLEYGKFSHANHLLEKMSSEAAEVGKLKEVMNRSVRPGIQFQFRKAGEADFVTYPSDSPKLGEVILAHNDSYRLRVTTPPGQGRLYLYLFRKDGHGKITMLLPHSRWSRVRNPVGYNQRYRIPPENEWLFLDELPPYESGFVYETLYVIASPWRAGDVEEYYHKVIKETEDNTEETEAEEGDESLRDFLETLRLRRDSKLKAVFYGEFSFKHARDRKEIQEMIEDE